MCIGLRIKHKLFLSDINQTWTYSRDLWNMLEFQISWKSVQWETSCSVRTDRQDMTKLIVDFSDFVNTPKKDS